MGNMNNMLIVFSFILLLGTSAAFCPSKCTCDGDKYLRASCVDAGLEVVPIQLNPEVKSINLAKNLITSVHYTLSFYMSLEKLDLSQNRIESLGGKNFEYQYDLGVLDLSRNLVGSLGKDAFRGLKKLRALNLSDNFIEGIHSNAMADLVSLVELDLTNNRIISFEDSTFQNLSALEVLLLENNQILEVPTSNLLYCHQLRHLDLTRNFIESVRNESFLGLRHLEHLELDDNVIKDVDVDAFTGLVALTWLDIADNNLTVMPTVQLSKLSNLTNLSLSGNSFSYLPAVALLNLFNLRELHLDRLERLTRIDSRAFVDNTHLQLITLDANPAFCDLPPRLFHGNPNLVDISMRSNGLMTLDAIQFPLDRLRRLHLAENPLECNCSLLWLWRLVHEEEATDVGAEAAATGETLTFDRDAITCDVLEDNVRTRRRLIDMSEGEIQCPARLVTIVCAILTVLLVTMAGVSVVLYVQFARRRKRMIEERKNVNERIVPQQIDKMELERYLQAQALTSEYRTLRPWEIPIKEADREEPDHYEKFDYFDHRRMPPPKAAPAPHVVYV
ncbi:vasorin-like [Lutzomyia longipalpis]|uniref:vasorin-like n=1 Tax=Lutzomyia longipalpis TaxID=7200 RepID=UPI0024837B49|nr:vasorin-like [Lutzomyia longipalpis]XP_055693807.1 vasorin-like [Lutzomyia longipalpis]XP_055693808.1 vasorin-like [Lutzomyia longipalpis]XP_055693809.1 vasorin-like [Lutzomyia longipalpis]XP_055693810.1 vasorin-like [Lutzomyia longipalpis]